MSAKKRLIWCGIDYTVASVRQGDFLHATAYDLIFIGSGQDQNQSAIIDDMRTH